RRTRTEKNPLESSQGASLKMMRVSAAAVFAVLCLIGVAAITREDGAGTIGEQAKQFWAQLSDGQSETDDAVQVGGTAQAGSEVHNSGTLMAENSLVDAIQQENQQAAAVSGQAVTGQTQSEEDGQTTQPQETPKPQAQEEQQEPDTPETQESQEAENPEASGQENEGSQEIPAQGPATWEIEAQQQAQPVSYVIQPGDTLIGISTRQYGNDSYVQAICDLNGITNADNIQIGQKILLP
ncbi:MAG: LysM peptidoglycan-binding domain-containing protein, partial [Acetatifactor sp.]|nr:LysM peptidoglycan-binding domain-containing protein [Acetatifactor sp.]